MDTYALPSISISNSSLVTITGDDVGGYVTPSSNGSLGVGVDHINITTDCSAGYHFYVSGTSTSGTDLVREDADNPSDLANRIPSSSIAPSSPSPLAKNTWGVGKNGTDFTKIQEYNENIGSLTPLYSNTNNTANNTANNTNDINTSTSGTGNSTSGTGNSTSETNGSISNTFDVYFGVNISTDKEPGIYSGNVLYTAVLDDACLKYTLNFDTSSATDVDPNALSPQSIDYNENVDLSPYSLATVIKRTGYTLSGWEYTVDGIKHEFNTNSNENINPEELSKVTLSPVWTPNTYTIRYNGNGGSGTTTSQTGQAYDATTTLQPNGFFRTSHHFKGWAYESTATEPDFESAETNVSVSELTKNNASGSVADTNGGTVDLYAVWDVNNYTFVYDVNGGTGTPASASSSASYDGTIVPPGVGTMAKDKSEFIGWSLSKTAESVEYNANTTYDVSTIVSAAGKTNENNAEITLYAVWSGAPYTLTTINGNTTAISSISPSGNTTKRYGASVTVSCTPNSGYHCTGWTSSDTSKLPSSSNASYTFSMPEGITLTASGAANTYTIKYNANGGTGTTSSQTGQAYGSTTTLRSNGFSRTGYTFKGWAYSSSASSANFSAGQSNVSVSALASNNVSGSVVDTNGGVINLYAVWDPIYYTLNVSNGYINSTGSTSGSYIIGSSIYVCNSSPGTYYDFSYWGSNNGGSFSSQYSSCTYFTMPSNNVTVTANYNYNPPTYYTLRIVNGYLGTSGTSTSGSYTAGSTVTVRAVSPGAYHDFSNWSSNNGGSFASRYSTTTTFTMPSNDVTITANYDYNPPTYYTLTVSGGTGSGSYTSGATVSISADTPASGKEFSHWSSSGGGSFSDSSSSSTTFTMPSSSVTVTANYKDKPVPVTYTVTFNKNGGNSVSSSSKTVVNGEAYGTLPTAKRNKWNGFESDGWCHEYTYTFNGWYTTKSSGGVQITADTIVDLTGNQTLYARWKSTQTAHYGSTDGGC